MRANTPQSKLHARCIVEEPTMTTRPIVVASVRACAFLFIFAVVGFMLTGDNDEEWPNKALVRLFQPSWHPHNHPPMMEVGIISPADPLAVDTDQMSRGSSPRRTPHLLLHVGPAKTGSTYLQSTCAQLTTQLQQDKYQYFGGHHDSPSSLNYIVASRWNLNVSYKHFVRAAPM